MGPDDAEGLRRDLNFGQAASVVVGIVVGSGIFIGANRVAAGVDNTFMLFGVWVIAGLMTLLGALTYAEFGAMFPKSGGDYVYAGESLGRFWGFFNGWLAFAINYPASMAFLALAWASQLDQLKPGAHRILFFDEFSLRFTAIAVLLVFTVVNYYGVRQGGWTQFGVTAAKVVLILGLVLLAFFSPESDAGNLGDVSAAPDNLLVFAFVAALFAYDGWTGVSRIGAEVKDPQRNVPRALILGILGVIALYLLLTLAYVLALGLDGMRGEGLPSDDQRAIASRAADALFGNAGKTFVSLLILVSILGPINGLTLAGPRVYFAMARDRLFPPLLARVHPVHQVPHWSILFQSGLSILLVVFFTFEQLQGYVVLASWTAYGLTGVGLMVFRRKQPDRPRPYRVPFYPFVPILFVSMSVAFVGYLIWSALTDDARIGPFPTEFLYLLGNLLVMALAVPIYRLFVRRLGAPSRVD